MPFPKISPRAPDGPSVTYSGGVESQSGNPKSTAWMTGCHEQERLTLRGGIPSRLTSAVRHCEPPASRDSFSSKVSWATRVGTSTLDMVADCVRCACRVIGANIHVYQAGLERASIQSTDWLVYYFIQRSPDECLPTKCEQAPI